MVSNRIFICFFLLLNIFFTRDAFGKTIPKQYTLVGQASLSILWWEIYEAELYTQSGQYQDNQIPIYLKLTYRRNIDSQELIEETQSQWKRFDIVESKQRVWLSQLESIWPNVKENDSIAFFINAEGVCNFYFNDEFIGSVASKEFSQNFANIWLAPNGPYPKMTRRLTGKDKR